MPAQTQPLHPRGSETGFDSWTLETLSEDAKTLLRVRLETLVSLHGFKQLASATAKLIEKTGTSTPVVHQVRQDFPISSFFALEEPGKIELRLGECAIRPGQSEGKLTSLDHVIEWNLEFSTPLTQRIQHLPALLAKSGLPRAELFTENACFTAQGTVRIDGREIPIGQGTALFRHSHGDRYPNRWVWAHSSRFVDESGKTSDLVFEGVESQVFLPGGVRTPKLLSFYFFYRGKPHLFRSLGGFLRSKSATQGLEIWKFRADGGELSFRGEVRSELKGFESRPLEDTDGSYLYVAETSTSSVTVSVYRRGKLETTLFSTDSGRLEIADRVRPLELPIRS